MSLQRSSGERGERERNGGKEIKREIRRRNKGSGVEKKEGEEKREEKEKRGKVSLPVFKSRCCRPAGQCQGPAVAKDGHGNNKPINQCCIQGLMARGQGQGLSSGTTTLGYFYSEE